MAANQGDADAQANLAFSYELGNGVAKDYVQAYLWYGLVVAAHPRDANALQGLQTVSKKLTPAQISEAQALVKNWAPK